MFAWDQSPGMGWKDDRGVSEVLGAILLFGIVVMAIGGYQAFVVPSVNADAEFRHSGAVQNELVDLRTETLQAAATNEPRSATVTLGLEYPTRLLAVNPRTPAGTFRTIDGGDITLDGDADLRSICGTGDGDPPDTKFLQYQPDYNEHTDALPIELEHTLLYRPADGGALFHTDQALVQGNEIHIVRFVGDVSRTSSQSESIDLYPSATGFNGSVTANEISIPSRLSAADWNRTLESESLHAVDAGEDAVEIKLDDVTYDIRCTTIGINEKPDVSPVREDTRLDSEQFNPLRDVALVDSVIEGRASVSMEFDNRRDNDVEIVSARLIHYSIAGGERSEPAEDLPPDWGILNESGTETRLEVGGSLQSLNQTEGLAKGDTSEVEIAFEHETEDFKVEPGDWYFLFLEFEDETDGERFSGTYVVAPGGEGD